MFGILRIKCFICMALTCGNVIFLIALRVLKVSQSKLCEMTLFSS